ncbi:MAG: tyrosine-type recombinase/integrase [Prevotellaceae bacterium]|nr:tyrosine-type recombinase/integrase [Prevotellaceae bacterium]
MTKIKIGDISIKEQTVFVAAQISKNRRDGLVALNDEIVKLMIELNVFSYPSNYYLFGNKLSPSESKASYNLFRQKFLAVRKELNFPDSYMFYSLKDSGIRDLANTQGIVVAKEQARHSDVSVTNHYLVGRDRKVNEETKHFKGYL